MNKAELKEQLQQDLMAYLDGQPEEVLTEVCNIVVRNVNQLEDTNPTHSSQSNNNGR
ncbi:MAG: hypothetical protein P8J32_04510 [bacterium]|nr:hypothetical protein [bacterium]